MKSLGLVLILALLSAGPACWAGGLIRISGKLSSITETHFLVETKLSVYYVRRKAVMASDEKRVDRAGTQVSWSVPLDAIERVTKK